MRINPLVLISGPSGSGKTTIVRHLEMLGCWEAISHTTRERRDGEVDGVNYYYVSKDEFKLLNKSGGFYEVVEVFDGNSYGISKSELDFRVKEKTTLLIAEPSGVLQIEKRYKLGPIIKIWLEARPGTCTMRMIERGDTIEKVQKRVSNDADYFPKAKEMVRWDYYFDNDEGSPEAAAFYILTRYIHPVINQIQLDEMRKDSKKSFEMMCILPGCDNPRSKDPNVCYCSDHWEQR